MPIDMDEYNEWEEREIQKLRETCPDGYHWVKSYTNHATGKRVKRHCSKNPDRGAEEVYDTSYGRPMAIAKSPDEEGDFNFVVYDREDDSSGYEGSGKSFKEARSKARKIARKIAYGQEIEHEDL